MPQLDMICGVSSVILTPVKISVIASFYNIESYVSACIDSVLSQKGEFELEVIAVDDCSQDGTLAALQQYQDQRLRVIHHEHNQGLSAARNTGMDAMTGDCFYLLDGDDYLPEGALAALVERYADDVDWVQGAYSRVDEHGVEFETCRWPTAVCSSHDEVVRNLSVRSSTWVTNRLVNKKYKSTHFAVGKNHEDVFWNLDVFPYLNKIIIVDRPTYCYVLRTSSLSQQRVASPERGKLWMQHMFEAIGKMLSMNVAAWDDIAAAWLMFHVEQYVFRTPTTFPFAVRRDIRLKIKSMCPMRGDLQNFSPDVRLLHCLIESNLPDAVVWLCYKLNQWERFKLRADEQLKEFLTRKESPFGFCEQASLVCQLFRYKLMSLVTMGRRRQSYKAKRRQLKERLQRLRAAE